MFKNFQLVSESSKIFLQNNVEKNYLKLNFHLRRNIYIDPFSLISDWIIVQQMERLQQMEILQQMEKPDIKQHKTYIDLC